MRTRTLLLLAIVLTVATVWVGGLMHGARPEPVRAAVAEPLVAAPLPVASRALAVLRAWDGRRSSAWRRGDARALARLYARGSVAGLRDVADLARWRKRGLRVAGLRQQLTSLHVVRHSVGSLLVQVTERTVGGVALGRRTRLGVPQSAWASHRIALERVGRRWLVSEVRMSPE
jgi:hypothetical protein